MKLGLGTVQFGLDYGISNLAGRIPEAGARAVLEAAAEAGVEVLDTAPAYGGSEATLGALNAASRFQIVTKTPPLGTSAIGPEELARVRASFETSLASLGTTRLHGVLVHHVEDLLVSGGERIFEQLEALKAEGSIAKIGVSVYDASALEAVLDRFSIDLVQLPLNVFDQRLVHSGHLRSLKALGVEIHVRSVFLQGLLLMEPEALPASVAVARPHVARYRAFLKEAGLSPLEGALAFVRQVPAVDHVLVGVANSAQFEEIDRAWRRAAVERLDFSTFTLDDTKLLNPARWKEAVG